MTELMLKRFGYDERMNLIIFLSTKKKKSVGMFFWAQETVGGLLGGQEAADEQKMKLVLKTVCFLMFIDVCFFPHHTISTLRYR